MKKLENKIISKIYKLETRKTASEVFGEIMLLLAVLFSSVFIFSTIIEILNDQSSFDLFDFLRDDVSIIQQTIINNSWLFFQELPLPLICVLIGLLLSVIWLIFIFIKNFGKFRNKIVSIYKFWSK